MRIRAYFELVRLPNIFTAVGDPLAGFLFAGGLLSDWQHFTPVLLSAANLYAAGVALNDLRDVRRDRLSRPRRPIPSGRISRARALWLVIALLCAGIIFATLRNGSTFTIATLLAGSIVMYDVVLKRTPAAPAFMGLCRALNLTLGMSAVDGLSPSWHALIAAALMWLYVTSVTCFARAEQRHSRRGVLTAALAGIVAAVAGQGGLHMIMPDAPLAQLGLLAALVIVTLRYGRAAIHDPSRVANQSAVTVFLLGILVFDASLVWLARGPGLACVVIALLIPTTLLAKSFRMT